MAKNYIYTIRMCLLLLTTFMSTQTINAQCVSEDMWPFSPVSAPQMVGGTVNVTTCLFAGEYSEVNQLSIGATYEVTCSNNAYIFITDVENNLLKEGSGVVVLGNAEVETIRIHIFLDTECTTNSECKEINVARMGNEGAVLPNCIDIDSVSPANLSDNVSNGNVTFSWGSVDGVVGYRFLAGIEEGVWQVDQVVEGTEIILTINGFDMDVYWAVYPITEDAINTDCDIFTFRTMSAPGYCLNGSLYPTTVVVPAVCDGVTEHVVSTIQYAGEYFQIQVEEGVQYVFNSSVATDHLTISNNGEEPIEYGTVPLTWVSDRSGVVFVHVLADDQCTTQNASRTTSYVCGIITDEALDWGGLQWPATIVTQVGGEGETVYAQVFEAGLTDVEPLEDAAEGISVWIGVSNVNTDPSTWNNWVLASHNSAHVSNNDEYMATIGQDLAVGTYYYAARFRLNDGQMQYGGISEDGVAGFWDGEDFMSGVLTVESNGVDGCLVGTLFPSTAFTPTCTGSSQEITNFAWAGEYSNVNVVEGQTYIFEVSNGEDLITIANATGIYAYASGVGSVTWVSTLTGVVRFYNNTQDCGSGSSSRIKSVTCGDLPTEVPNCPTLLGPLEGVVGQLAIDFSWQPAQEGPITTSYRIVIFDGETEVINQVVNNTVFTATLAGETNYSWTVYAINSVGESTECSMANFTTPVNPFGEYCGPMNFTSNVEPISYVVSDEMGISNLSSPALGAPAHELFLDVVGQVAQGETYVLAVDGNTAGTSFTNNIVVFVDWNQNGVFTDEGEYFQGQIVGSDGSGAGAVEINITVPSDAVLGETRMRIKKIFGTSNLLNPCVGSGFGQAEDYTINVNESLNTTDFVFEGFRYYPNPLKDTLRVENSSLMSSILVYNMIGQEVLVTSPNQFETTLDVSGLTSGTYMMKIVSQEVSKTVKLIKK